MYIITKPDLIQVTQKQHKVLAYPPVEADFASKVCGVSQAAKAIVNHNVSGAEGETGFSMESHVAMRSALSPGKGFDDMNRKMIQNILLSLGTLQQLPPQSVRTGLMDFVRSRVTSSTTDAVYGPQNPFRDHAVVDAFW